MRYLPNQYINPALTIRDREIAREPNMEDAPYRLFKRDTSTDDPEDYRGKPAYGVEEDGQGFFTFPFVQAPDKKNTNKGMTIAGAQDIDTKQFILRNGMMVDENQIKYMWSPREKKFIDMGPYDPYYDGLPIPLGKRNSDMKIAGLPHTPPSEKMVVGKKLMDSPLRFRTDAERIRFMEDFAKYDRPRT